MTGHRPGFPIGRDAVHVRIYQPQLHNRRIVWPQILRVADLEPGRVNDPGFSVDVVIVDFDHDPRVEVRPPYRHPGLWWIAYRL